MPSASRDCWRRWSAPAACARRSTRTWISARPRRPAKPTATIIRRCAASRSAASSAATVAQPTAAKPNAGAAAAPGNTASTTTSSRDGESSSSATRNYELDRTISHVSDPAGRLARLTVAVVVDDKLAAAVAGAASGARDVPFTPQELQHLTDLVKNAVGFDAARGDSVSVINQAFH